MHWTEDGGIQITRKFALWAAVVTTGLTLAAMFLIGMIIEGDGRGTEVAIDPTPSVMSDEQEGNRESSTSPQAASKSEYSTCLARTWRATPLDIYDVEFEPRGDRTTTGKVDDLTELRHMDYIVDHCRPLAPEPPASPSATCIPRELQTFYRKHIPEGSDTTSHVAIAAEYAPWEGHLLYGLATTLWIHLADKESTQ